MRSPPLADIQDHMARGRLTVFVGADLPASLTGLPSRADLARGLVTQHGLSQGLGLAEAAQRLIQSGSSFLAIDYLGRQLDTHGISPARFHQLVARLPVSSVVTTCYDDLLERAYQAAGVAVNLVVRDNDLQFVDRRRPTLIKLYGDLQQRDTLIITEDDHFALWRNREKENILAEVGRLLRTTAVLFLGHDLSDPDVKLLWREMINRTGRFQIGAYAITPGMAEDERQVWVDRQIRCYDGDVLALLEALVTGARPVPPPEVALVSQPAATGELTIWLRRRGSQQHEAIVTFRPPNSRVDEQLISGAPPVVALDDARLREQHLALDAYGEALSAVCFADTRLSMALTRAQERAWGARASLRLRLQLDADDPMLHAVRWELLRDPLSGRFLATSAQTLVSRYLSSSDSAPFPPVDRARPSALVAVAAPTNLDAYRLPAIDAPRALEHARAALDGYALDELPHATLPALVSRLQGEPAVLYLLAHGAFGADQAVVYLEDQAGMTAPVPVSRLATAIGNSASRPRLVVLAACTGAGISDTSGQALIALGPQLALAGVGAVVALYDQVALSTIETGMPPLFQALRQHGSIDRAVAAMRNILASGGDDWWQPVLYMRLHDGQLW